jgi:hypothetical protein
MSTNEVELFSPVRAEISQLVTDCLTVEVTDEVTAASAMECAKALKKMEATIDDRRKELVAPHNEVVKRINGFAKLLQEPLHEAEAHVKSQLAIWNDILEERRLKELESASKDLAAKKAQLDAQLAAEREEQEALALFQDPHQANQNAIITHASAVMKQAEVEQSHREHLKSLEQMKVSGSRKVWRFEIQDAGLVPREYLTVDEKKIRAAVREGAREIPGVRIYQETQIAIATNH